MIRALLLAALLAGCSTERHGDVTIVSGRMGRALWNLGIAGSCLPGIKGEPRVSLYAPTVERTMYRAILAGDEPPSGGTVRDEWAKLAGYIEHERAHARQLEERGAVAYLGEYLTGAIGALFDGDHPWKDHPMEREALWSEWTVRLSFFGQAPAR